MADRRRRRRASQDSEEEEEESGSESAAPVEKPGLPGRSENRETGVRTEPAREGDQSECESEDGIEGDAVLSDYESAEESEVENGGHYSEEEPLKTALKSENNAGETTTTKEEKVKSKGAVTGERQSGDGQESTEPDEIKASRKSQKQLDDDEDRKNPAYIPRKGLFFEHDLRGHTNDEEVRPKGRHPRKLWKDEGRWEHDRFREDEQAPKSRDELVAMYGYDIRSCRNPEDIRPRRPRKPRYSSPSREEDQEEMPIRPSNRYISDSGPPPRTYNNRNSLGNNRAPSNRTYSRPGGYKENRPASYPPDDNTAPPSTSERRQDYGDYRARSREQTPQSPDESLPEVGVPNKAEPVTEKQAADPSPPPPDRPIEKKSYSRARRSRIKGGEAGKSIDDTTFPELPPPPLPQIPPEVVPEPSPSMPIVKQGNWEPVDGGVSGLEQDMSQVNISEQNWSPGQAPYISARGIPNHIHMAGGPPAQYGRMEGMGGRVKRYSSQRQRPVPDPAPMHISLMEGHYYDPLQFQGPIYAHGDGPSAMPPQGMIVPQEMHLPHPGLHPHQSPAPMSTPNLYPAPVSIPPAQPPPPQQLLPPPYFTAPPGVINFGNPAYPTYAPGALPPPPAHIYPNAQAQSQVYGGVTYYNPAQQHVQPKLSPPRRTSQPVTIKPPPPEDDRHLKLAKEKASA